MELVYLWVENYKNIQKQGFNFSPRFECDFDGKNLTIDKKEDYVSIFPDNINITAIVGENGAGKSNLLQLIHGRYTHLVNCLYVVQNIDKLYIYQIKKVDLTKEPIVNRLYSGVVQNIIDLNIKPIKEKNGFIKLFSTLLYSSNPMSCVDKTDGFIKKSHTLSIFDDEIGKDNKSIQIRNILYMMKKNAIFDSIFKLPENILIELLNTSYLPDNKEIQDFVNSFFNKKNIVEFKRNEYKKIPINEYIVSIYNRPSVFKYFEFNWVPQLSTGQEQYIYQLSNFYYFIDCHVKDKSLILCIDEGELSLHPNWQKKYIYFLINFLHKNFPKKRIHIIISSHSPFILSDLPKENVIFLEKGEPKYPFKDKQTFGANIHTLLSDGFFMSDGLMGEFAKGKIEKVIKLLNSEKKLTKKRKQYCKNIISIVGEPILKTTLENMYDEKLYKNESKLHRLKRKQKKLDKEIKVLKAKTNAKD